MPHTKTYMSASKKINVTKGKQGFQPTAKSAPDLSGLPDGFFDDAPILTGGVAKPAHLLQCENRLVDAFGNANIMTFLRSDEVPDDVGLTEAARVTGRNFGYDWDNANSAIDDERKVALSEYVTARRGRTRCGSCGQIKTLQIVEQGGKRIPAEACRETCAENLAVD